MNMRDYLKVTLAALLLLGSPAFAQQEEWAEKEGVIREIRLADRTAIIDGYRYYFGTSGGYQTANIELLNYSVASFEMLEVDMKVQFHYTFGDPWFRILRLRQLPYDAWDETEGHSDYLQEAQRN